MTIARTEMGSGPCAPVNTAAPDGLLSRALMLPSGSGVPWSGLMPKPHRHRRQAQPQGAPGEPPQLTREGPDLSVYAIDLGGLVAHDDGSFTLLTRRDDPGEPLRDTTTTDTVGKAAYLVHILGTTELFAQPLTGTSSITRASDPMARDCAPSLNGRLVWNGSKYGAYFAVHGCEGDPHEPYYGDKLVYADGDGNYLKGGWSWNCSISQGVRLLP